MPFSLKVSWGDAKYAQLGDIIIDLEDQYDAEMNTYYGQLGLLRDNHFVILADVRFVPVGPFPPDVYGGGGGCRDPRLR